MNQTGVASTGSRRQARRKRSFMPSNAVRAASIVASISAGPWAIERNHASNCDGGSRTP